MQTGKLEWNDISSKRKCNLHHRHHRVFSSPFHIAHPPFIPFVFNAIMSAKREKRESAGGHFIIITRHMRRAKGGVSVKEFSSSRV